MIRLLVASNHPVLRESLRYLFNLVRDIQVVAEANTPAECLAAVGDNHVDLLLWDLAVAGIYGGQLLSELRSVAPDLPILALAPYKESAFERWALQAGATAFLGKDVDPEHLLALIRTTARQKS